MCVYKQGEKWWYEFEFRGQRVFASSRSTDKAVALLIEAEHRRSLELGTGGVAPTLEAIKTQGKAGRIARALPPVLDLEEPAIESRSVNHKRESHPAAQMYSAEPAVTGARAVGLKQAG